MFNNVRFAHQAMSPHMAADTDLWGEGVQRAGLNSEHGETIPLLIPL